MVVIWYCVVPAGMIGTGPGLTFGMNAVIDMALYTWLDTQSHRIPKDPLPRWLLMDVTFVLRWNLRPRSVLKDGCPAMSVIVGCVKPSMIFSVEAMFFV